MSFDTPVGDDGRTKKKFSWFWVEYFQWDESPCLCSLKCTTALQSCVPAKTASNSSCILGNASHLCACVHDLVFKDLVLGGRSALECVHLSPKCWYEKFGVLEISYGCCNDVEALSVFLQFSNCLEKKWGQKNLNQENCRWEQLFWYL